MQPGTYAEVLNTELGASEPGQERSREYFLFKVVLMNQQEWATGQQKNPDVPESECCV